MGLVPPPLWEVPQVLKFPQGIEQVSESWIMASHDDNWAEYLSTWFPALVKCEMGLHTARCWPVSHFGDVIHLLVLSHKKKLFFCMIFGVGHLLADICWYCFVVWWLAMSWNNSASCW